MDAPYEVSKNRMEVVRFQITEYRGKSYADMRVLYRHTVTDELNPGKKGICVSPAIWREFVRGIEALEKAMDEAGLLEENKETM